MRPANPVFISAEQIAQRVKELGRAISEDLRKDVSPENPLTCVAVLKGSFVFLADLIRAIDLPLTVDFLGASSYGQRTHSSGAVKITLDLSSSIQNRHVLLVEDIVDTGLTMNYLLETLRVREPASLRLCTLLLKPSCLKMKVPIDYLGFTIDNRFVIGYGLDIGEQFRNLPHLSVHSEGESPPPRKGKK